MYITVVEGGNQAAQSQNIVKQLGFKNILWQWTQVQSYPSIS